MLNIVVLEGLTTDNRLKDIACVGLPLSGPATSSELQGAIGCKGRVVFYRGGLNGRLWFIVEVFRLIIMGKGGAFLHIIVVFIY